MLALKSISKSFHDGESELLVLDGIDLTLKAGESMALLGASGNGKSTLLQIAAGLEEPDSGNVQVLGQDLSAMNERELALMRRQHLGFVFQQFNLLPGLDVQNNILFQRRLNRLADRDAWVDELIDVLELAPLLHRPVEVLSGGQQQRVAIARALAGKPRFLLADEPTGNLDSEMADIVMKLLESINADGTTIVMVTHDPDLAHRASRNIHILDGRASDLVVPASTNVMPLPERGVARV